MIVDLAAQSTEATIAADVLIIGGGIAGLLLATKLRGYDLRIVVFESGGMEQVEETHPLNRVLLLGDDYQGAMHGRFRCLGGTSTRWGGALIPFLEQDLAPRPYLEYPLWPVGMEVVEPYLPEIEGLFGVDAGSYDEGFVHEFRAEQIVPTGDPDFLPRFAKWPIFRHRNVANLLKAKIEGDPDLTIWINATATDFDLDTESGRLRAATARHQGGNRVTASATHVALCAGAIESTRLLLLLNRQYEDKLFKRCNALGRYFYDHISAPIATITAKQVTRLNRLAGFRFSGTTMRSLRFELAPGTQAREGVPSSFGHISVRTDGATSFDALRDLMRSLQQSGRFSPRLAFYVLRDLPYLARATYWRYVLHQLYWPRPARYELEVVVEQGPRSNNRITLADEKDPFGLAWSAIHWRIDEPDCAAFSAYCRLFDAFWRRHGLQKIGDLKWLADPNSISVKDIDHGGDIFHPGGSTRMGNDGRSAVVDKNLRTHAIPNLWVSSTSVFPSGASANPTLMLMLFTMRLADDLKNEFARSAS